jgi:hypothetical protein
MHQKKTSALTAIAIAAALALAACGGGGGGNGTGAAAPASSPSGSGASASQTSIPPKTSVPPTTFPATTMQAATFAQLNAYRLAMGVGEVAQDPALDTSAQAHALYLDSNLASGNLTTLDHNESAALANFYAETPLARAQKAGAPVTEFIGEDIGDGLPQASNTAYASDCVGKLLDSVYHLQSLTGNQETVGIGFQQSFGTLPTYTCVLDFGQTTGVSGTPQPNGLPVFGGQQMPSTAIAHSPLSNESGIATTMSAESPNPASDILTPGRPIMVRVAAPNPGDVLNVFSFTLTAAGGSVVPARIIVPSAALAGSSSGATADPNGLLAPGVAFLLPLVALASGTTYTATFSGSRDGTPVNVTWSFTTSN